MKRLAHCTSPLLVLLFGVFPALSDGGFFFREGVAADLAQTRQEVLLAFYQEGEGAEAVEKVTYVLGSRYAGTPETLAWVVPVPATPSDVVAHENRTLFDTLDQRTRPRFIIFDRDEQPDSFGCACAGMAPAGGREGNLVEVEAQGEAGIFSWAALTSSGSAALLEWLNQNGFTVPSQAGDILDDYIRQDMHFLAVRVREPEEVPENDAGEIEIPPIQFTCETSQRFYPLAISQVSAADDTEVLIYVLADHRAAAANVPNVLIDADQVAYDPASSSETNYEALFAAAIAAHDGVALITEYAEQGAGVSWVTAPLAVLELGFLTRMRTVIARERMELDFDFQDAADDTPVYGYFSVDVPGGASVAALAGQPLGAVLLYGGVCVFLRRRARRRHVRRLGA